MVPRDHPSGEFVDGIDRRIDFTAELSLPLGQSGDNIAEGRVATPAQAAEALRCGAFAVVVGTAITRPAVITRSFVEALPRSA